MLEKFRFSNVRYFGNENKPSPFALKVVESAQKAGLEAIAHHKAIGNPIYYKKNGQLIKEMADGTQYLVKVSKNGIETIGKLQ